MTEEKRMTQLETLDGQGMIRLVDYMGDDSAIVQSARVSYGKGTRTISTDRSLIRYLISHHHETPFEMCELKFHVKAPLFVARQWFRHRTGSFNEVSARYSDVSNDVYNPTKWREQSVSNKQGSGQELDCEENEKATLLTKNISSESFKVYLELRRMNVSKEMARFILPQSVFTEFYWKTNLRNLFHFLQLRIHKHAQKEIREYAEKITEIIKPLFPIAVEAWENYRLRAVTFSEQEMRLIRQYLNQTEGALQADGLEKRERKEFFEKIEGKDE